MGIDYCDNWPNFNDDQIYSFDFFYPYKQSPTSLSKTKIFPSPQPATVRLEIVSNEKTASEVFSVRNSLKPPIISMIFIDLSALPVITTKIEELNFKKRRGGIN